MIVCGTCTECCRGPDRVLVLTKPYPWLQTQRVGTVRVLAQKPNGDCIYLTAHGCGIYGVRPDECRAYDCRDHMHNSAQPPRIRKAARRIVKLQGMKQ